MLEDVGQFVRDDDLLCAVNSLFSDISHVITNNQLQINLTPIDYRQLPSATRKIT
jgi:hypothetical protein